MAQLVKSETKTHPGFKLNIPCRFDGKTVKRFGEITLRFRVDEQYKQEAVKIMLAIGNRAAAAIKVDGKNYIVGVVDYGGVRFDRVGEAVIALDGNASEIQLTDPDIVNFVDQDIVLCVHIKVDLNGD